MGLERLSCCDVGSGAEVAGKYRRDQAGMLVPDLDRLSLSPPTSGELHEEGFLAGVIDHP